MQRFLRRLAIVIVALIAVAAAPIVYVETACRVSAEAATAHQAQIGPALRRPEVRTYLTYPEWYIVHAYEDFARILEEDDEHAFAYWRSIKGFWTAMCGLNRRATRGGGTDADVKVMLYTIGHSFTAEMALKAIYEETVGRVAAGLRGEQKTPQDILAARMAGDYAAFLHQTPWYRYDFVRWRRELLELPRQSVPLRQWERTIALGAEWSGKTLYAALIEKAVGALPPPVDRNVFVISGASQDELAGIDGLTVVSSLANGRLIAEGPRYRAFTALLREIAERGATVEEVAGNDDVLVSLLRPQGGKRPPYGQVIAAFPRQGASDERVLIDLRVRDVTRLMRQASEGAYVVEHVYDY